MCVYKCVFLLGAQQGSQNEGKAAESLCCYEVFLPRVMQLNVFHMFVLTVQGHVALQETNAQSLVYALL